MFQLPDHICVRLQNIQAAAPNQAKISPDTNINKSLGTVVYPSPSSSSTLSGQNQPWH